jgi:hypothetical protein
MSARINQSSQPRRRLRRSRGGVVVIVALVCLLIVTSIVGSMLQSALRARRQLHAERDCRQTELLLEAGADRAAASLAATPEFRGDTWEVPAAEIVGHGAGRVITKLSRSDDERFWQLRVVAEYPLGRDFPIMRSQTFQFSSSTIRSQE